MKPDGMTRFCCQHLEPLKYTHYQGSSQHVTLWIWRKRNDGSERGRVNAAGQKRCANTGLRGHQLMTRKQRVTTQDKTRQTIKTPPCCVRIRNISKRCCLKVDQAFGSLFKCLWLALLYRRLFPKYLEKKKSRGDGVV